MNTHSMGQTAEGPQATQFATYAVMKGVPRWLLWEAVPNPDSEKKPRKVPRYVNGGYRGTTDTPEDWANLATYDAAKAALAQRGDGWGLAFALGPDGTGWHWQGIDFDDIVDNRLHDLADVWARGEGQAYAYAEYSPSGAGIHIIGYGRQFAPLGSNPTGIEAYSSGRFFTVTENALRDDGSLMDLAPHVEKQLAPRHALGRAPTASSGAPVEVVQVDAKTVSTLRSALTHLRADDRQLWVSVGHALKELGEVGRGLWLDWSQTSAEYRPGIDPKKWDDLSCDRTGWQSVIKKAQDAGWVNPASGAAQLPALPQETPAQMLGRMTVNWDGEDDPEVPDIVEGLVADEDVTLLGGHGGIGKSFLALQMACAVALGEPILGCKTRQNRVLYYSAEDSRKRLTRRLRTIVDKAGYDDASVKKNLLVLDASEVDPLFGETFVDVGSGEKPYMVKQTVGTKDFLNLSKMVEAFDPQLVIVDGASDTFDGNEIVRREVRAFIKLLRTAHPKRKVGVLLMVHIDRASARGHVSNDDGYAGSGQWHNSSRRRLWLQAEYEKNDETKKMEPTGTYVLRVMKNQDGKPLDDFALTNANYGVWQPLASFGGQFAPGPRVSTPPPNHGPVIAQLIQEHYERGQYITASNAPNAPNGPYAVLQHDPKFPVALKRAKRAASETVGVVQRLQREGVLEVETYKNHQRKNAQRWRVVPPQSEVPQDEQEGQVEPDEG
ncbi:AAA family ATPase [Tabrizicola fusiformis]|uniref:AAA family ATPase n=1 Tax=Tabrizicola sp. SY72 TaxID=2741673 RepID=UPI001572D15F|nr:AAA family ATPase [Tabrizicola sp. SY72]NTT85737.1 AAA family ATPase [Tabrizicola sp. SY72]